MFSMFNIHGSSPIVLLATIAMVFALFIPSACGAQTGHSVKGEVLVKFRSTGSASLHNSVRLMSGATVKSQVTRSGWHLVQLPADKPVHEAVEWFRQRPDVTAAEPNLIYKLHRAAADPYASKLSGLVKIEAAAAWDITTGSAEVVVGVADTGIDYTHPDLAANMWRNPGEVHGNGVDDDRNGFIDDVHGIDVRDNDSDPMDDLGHGTHVAGTIGAVGDNGIGVTGVCWTVRLMALRIGAVDGFATTAEIAKAYDYAVLMRQRGVNLRVINNSWGGDYPSAALAEVFGEASDAGILSVCSSGNDHRDTDAVAKFPAGYSCSGLISIAATDDCDELASFSNYGSRTVDLAAPGVGIFSTVAGGPFYASFSGTSMAAPHVSGAAALLLAKKPDIRVDQLRELLITTADVVPGKVPRRLNLARAMTKLATGGSLPPGDAPAAAEPRRKMSLVSRDPFGRPARGRSGTPSISADGRYVTFASPATNLVSGKSGDIVDVFVRDQVTGITVRVSETLARQGANASCEGPVISADGRFVAFVSAASNLVTGDGNSTEDVFLWNRETRAIELVSIRSRGGFGNGPSAAPSISADGRFIAFESDAGDMTSEDFNGARDVFVRDRLSRVTERISTSFDGDITWGISESPAISANGRFVAFHSSASNLAPGSINQVYDVFIRDRQTWAIEVVSVAPGGGSPSGHAVFPVVSDDGRFIAFYSDAANLDTQTEAGTLDVYLRDRQERTTRRISVGRDGKSSLGSSFPDSISGDGRYVTFTSDSARLANATLSMYRVFVYDRVAGTHEQVAFSEAGFPAQDNAFTSRITADGRYVAFASWTWNLVADDGNATMDVFVKDRGAIRADMSIRLKGATASFGEGLVGVEIVQRAQQQAGIGQPVVFEVTVVNTGTAAATFQVPRPVRPAEGWNVQFVGSNGTELPNEWQINSLAPGDKTGMLLRVTPLASASANRTLDVALTVYGFETDALDSVHAIVLRPHSPPDVLLASAADDGTPSLDNAELASISADGRYVSFSSDAANLVGSDTNYVHDAFLVDRTTQRIEIVSRTSSGEQANGYSQYASMSADGRFIAFESRADNLVPNDTNDRMDVFVKDRSNGAIDRVSVSAAGAQANRGSEAALISGNGQFVVFQSAASNLVPGDTNKATDVFVYDRDTRSVECVSRVPGGGFGNADSSPGKISADGRFILFTTLATNLGPLDTNGVHDLYLFDLGTQTLELLSATADGRAANEASSAPSLSNDGRWVLFASSATDLSAGEDSSGYYLLDRESRRLAGLSTIVNNLPAGFSLRHGALSPDGRWIGVAAGDTCETASRFNQLFLFDRQNGELQHVTRTRAGVRANEHTSGHFAFSADGRFLTVESWAGNLLNQDWHSRRQVFVYDQASFQPDSLAQHQGRPWRGEGILGNGQRVEQMVARTRLPIVNARVRNNARFADDLVVRANAAVFPYEVKYIDVATGRDITAEVTGAGFRITALPAGSSKDFRITVRLLQNTLETPVVTFTATSLADPAKVDAVQLVLRPDVDADNIADDWEVQQFGVLTRANTGTDADLDGVTDEKEFVAGTNPNSRESLLKITSWRPARDRVDVVWPSVPGRFYSLERASSVAGPFISVVKDVSADGAETQASDTNTGDAALRFYRIRADLP